MDMGALEPGGGGGYNLSSSLQGIGSKGQTSSGAGNAAFIGAGASIGADLVSAIYGLYQSQKESPQSRAARHIFERAKPESERLLSQLFYNPAAQGTRIPYSQDFLQHAPLQSFRNLYDYYLGREYGLPTSVASSLRAQAAQPLRVPRATPGASAAQVRAETQVNPQALSQAAVGRASVPVAGELDKLKNQGQLAAFNLWRAQQVGGLIG
jgi:hypothetical protein